MAPLLGREGGRPMGAGPVVDEGDRCKGQATPATTVVVLPLCFIPERYWARPAGSHFSRRRRARWRCSLIHEDAAATGGEDSPRSSVGELEASVLEALWRDGELSTPAMYETVGKPRQLAYTTILTVLQRLYRKGLVKREERGRSHLYSPAMSREQFAALRGQSLAGAFNGLGAAGVSAFLAEATRLDPELVAQLRREIERER